MKKQLGATLTELLIVILFLAGVWGWVWNIIKIVDAVNDPITLMLVFRAIGVFAAPLGAVLGFL
jgi:hypothetical protein